MPILAEYIDHMGHDLRVVNVARVTFDKESLWDLEEVLRTDGEPGILHREVLYPQDAKLVKFLSRHNHFTPFTHPQITMRETVPIFVARQRFKHVVGFTYNEVSRRYVDYQPEFYTPDAWRKRAPNVKQGSSDEVLEGVIKEEADDAYKKFCDAALKLYNDMLEYGNICPEQARMVLPQSMYTSYYVTGSLAAWARAYCLRSDPHAQKEIRDLADQWNTILRPLFPVAWEALTKKE